MKTEIEIRKPINDLNDQNLKTTNETVKGLIIVQIHCLNWVLR